MRWFVVQKNAALAIPSIKSVRLHQYLLLWLAKHPFYSFVVAVVQALFCLILCVLICLFGFSVWNNVFFGVYYIYMHKWPGVNVVDAVLPPKLCNMQKIVCDIQSLSSTLSCAFDSATAVALIWGKKPLSKWYKTPFYLVILKLFLYCYLSLFVTFFNLTATLLKFQYICLSLSLCVFVYSVFFLHSVF